MKESLLLELNLILESLEKNKNQSIEVRGAIAFGNQFKSSLSVIPEDYLEELKDSKEEEKEENKKQLEQNTKK